jgi:hypothetical protein
MSIGKSTYNPVKGGMATLFFRGELSGEYHHYTPISQMTTADIASFVWMASSVLAALYLWGYLFYHWNKKKFINKAVKLLWFFVILIGGILKFYGVVVYYVCVVELNLTVNRKNDALKLAARF